jgi:hypothetical protein
MAKRVFFSFHYQDVIDFRANVVRNHWLLKPDREAAGFFDASVWENAKRTGGVAVKRLVNLSLDRTAVTCVLIGSETYARPWVRYEILKSFKKGSNLLAVHINGIKGKDQRTRPNGPNPLEFVGVTFSVSGFTATLWEKVNGEWLEYYEVGGYSSYRINGVAKQFCGKGFNLANFFGEYDWVVDEGYMNFGTWVG